MAIVGVIPAAGHATRLQPLASSKETYPVHGRPVMDYLVERMRRARCSELRVVTRPEKTDVIERARHHGATVITARPLTPAASLLTGIRPLAGTDMVLFGFPDSIWEPIDGFQPLTDLVEDGAEIALGLFRTSQVERPDVVELDSAGRVTEVEVGSDRPPPHLIWGCAAARARSLLGLVDYDDPGDLLRSRAGTGSIGGVVLSETYVDIGTPRGLRQALETQGSASG
jgi:glucose-1-phosphate thymidylyltransferase